MSKKIVSNEDLLKEIQSLKKEVEDLKSRQLIVIQSAPVPHVCSPCPLPHQPYIIPWNPYPVYCATELTLSSSTSGSLS